MLTELAKQALSNLLRDDPEIVRRIHRGIEENRQGFTRIELRLADGSPVSQARIAYEQTRHEFHFGANAFMVGQFPEDAENTAYERYFGELFNLAVVPFFWDALEPRPGCFRFSQPSEPIYRRPPVDEVMAFCRRLGLTPKGHCLVWQCLQPSWAPRDRLSMERCLEERIRVIAECYGRDIDLWDVVNEPLQWNPLLHAATLPEDHVEKAFRVAGKYFPASAKLIYNEGPWVSWNDFHGDYTSPYLLARQLLRAGLPIRGLGLQYHLAFYGDNLDKLVEWSKQFSNARYIFAHLDQYAKLGLPLNISEITLPAQPELGDGEEFQALAAERLYKIWFSHPAVDGIVWWNLVDGTAFVDPQSSNNQQGENIYQGGLVRRDMVPKAAYRALHRLIRKEWHSSGAIDYRNGADNHFRGFYGTYCLTISTSVGEQQREIVLSKHGDNSYTLKLDQ